MSLPRDSDDRLLEDLKVCMLLWGSPLHDSRVLKEAGALTGAGAKVSLLTVGRDAPPAKLEPFVSVCFTRVEEPSDSSIRVLRAAVNLYREYRTHRRIAQAAEAIGADVYHCHDLNTLWSGMRGARPWAAPVVYDSHELYTEAGSWKPWRRAIFRRFERKALPKVDLVIAANKERAEIMHREYGAPTMPTVVMNTPLSSQVGVSPSPDAAVLREKTGARFVLIYQGGLRAGRGIDAAVRALRDLDDGVHLVLMGTGDPQPLLGIACAMGVRNRVHVWDPVEAKDTVSWTAAADAGIVTYLPLNRNNLYCAPNKLFEYAAAGLPVVCADLPSLRSIVGGLDIARFFEPGDPSSFASAVRDLLDCKQESCPKHESVLEFAEKHVWEDQAAALVAAYSKMIGALR